MPYSLPITGRVDRASATETVDLSSIPSRVKPKTLKIGIHSFLLDIQYWKGQCQASAVCGGQMAAWLEGRMVPSLPPGQGNGVNKVYLQLLSL